MISTLFRLAALEDGARSALSGLLDIEIDDTGIEPFGHLCAAVDRLVARDFHGEATLAWLERSAVIGLRVSEYRFELTTVDS